MNWDEYLSFINSDLTPWKFDPLINILCDLFLQTVCLEDFVAAAAACHWCEKF